VIDLHCHILPGIDDGASDLDDALAMARQAEADGIEIVCATPHIRHDHDVRIGELEGRCRDLNAALAEAGIRTRVDPAGEVAETIVEHLDADELATVALGSGIWILLEPAPGPLGDSLAAAVESLARRGFRSLVAHPERHLAADTHERLAALVGAGVLVQATAALLLEEGADQGMLALARRGLIHVLGSDAHSAAAGRPVRLSAGLARLGDVEPVGAHLDWVREEAPRGILAGRAVRPPYPAGRRAHGH
jgi:protein-tyrosine phosphatase